MNSSASKSVHSSIIKFAAYGGTKKSGTFNEISTGKNHDVGKALVKSLQKTKYSIDEKLEKSFISFFGQISNMLSDGPSDSRDAHESSKHTDSIKPLEQYQPAEEDEDDGRHGVTNSDDHNGSDFSDEQIL